MPNSWVFNGARDVFARGVPIMHAVWVNMDSFTANGIPIG